ncbi:MAG TPA: response regulator [Opitutaceae bacterium]|nr:response regulator [Opitutaceae bacterium]
MAHIVVIEDNEDLRELVAAVLTRNGHAVRHTADAQEGVELCRAAPTDVVITDLCVPHGDALSELLVRRRGARCPVVILITGLCDACRRYAGSVDAVLTKPFRMESLVGLVARAAPRERRARRRRTTT